MLVSAAAAGEALFKLLTLLPPTLFLVPVASRNDFVPRRPNRSSNASHPRNRISDFIGFLHLIFPLEGQKPMSEMPGGGQKTPPERDKTYVGKKKAGRPPMPKEDCSPGG